MHLRLAKPSDEPAVVNICARAFMEEDLFGRVIHPYRAQYPNDVKVFWYEWVRNDWSNPRNIVIVAVSSTSDEQEHVIGAAIWQRQGDDAGAQRIIAGWTDPGTFPVLPSTHNRAADPSKKEVLAQAAPFTKHYWAGPCAANWYLSLCCVDPDVKGRGGGRLLVRWGLDRAEAEDIRASVTASEHSDKFDQKWEFDEVVGYASEGEGNPLRKEDAKGGNILFMWVHDAKTAGGMAL